jgi:3'-5' exoribonuclease
MNNSLAYQPPISAAVDAAFPVAAASLTEKLPAIIRVESITYQPHENGVHTLCLARLYSDQASITVSWKVIQPDLRIQPWSLVMVRWASHRSCTDGAIAIDRLVLAERPNAATNLFTLVPHDKRGGERAVIARAARLFAALPRSLALVFNLLLWDGGHFRRYVRGPSSLNNHHNDWGGNLAHSVETAELARGMASTVNGVDEALLIIGGLLHDMGKLDEYTYDAKSDAFSLSLRGQLVGHRDTLLEWLAVALARLRPALPKNQHLALLHVLFASESAPDFVGLRRPRMIESKILAAADRVSGQQNLFARLRNESPEGGAGKYHESLRCAPFSLPKQAWGEAANDPVMGSGSLFGRSD